MEIKEYNIIGEIKDEVSDSAGKTVKDASGKDVEKVVGYELYDRKFYFKSVKGDHAVKFTDNTELLLCINGKQTTTKIEDLFISADFNSEYLRGYSALQIMESDGTIKLGDNKVAISFVEKNTGTIIYIYDVKKPLIIWNDEEITAEQMVKYGDILSGKGLDFPKEEIKPVFKETPLGGDDFFQKRQEMLEEGYREFANGNYRFYCYEENDEEEEVFFLKLKKEDFIDLIDDLEVVENDNDEEVEAFSFIEDEKKMLLLIDRAKGNMNISVMPKHFGRDLEAEAKEKAEAEAKVKAESDAKAKTEKDIKDKAEAEVKAEAEAKAKIEAETEEAK